MSGISASMGGDAPVHDGGLSSAAVAEQHNGQLVFECSFRAVARAASSAIVE